MSSPIDEVESKIGVDKALIKPEVEVVRVVSTICRWPDSLRRHRFSQGGWALVHLGGQSTAAPYACR